MRNRLAMVIAVLASMLGGLVVTASPAHAEPWGPWNWYEVVAQNLDGRLEKFWRSGDRLVHQWEIVPGGPLDWSAPQTFTDGTMVGSPAVERYADGRLGVFVTGTNYRIYHKWQTCAGCGWSPWVEMPGNGVASSNPKAGHNANGLIVVSVRGTTNHVHRIRKTSQNGPWTPWGDLGQPSASVQAASFPEVGYGENGELLVSVMGTNGHVWERNETGPATDLWYSWFQVG